VNDNFMKGFENVRDLSPEDDFREREFQRVQWPGPWRRLSRTIIS